MDKLLQVIGVETGKHPEDISTSMTMADLDLDSLEFVQLVLTVENEFHCKIDASQINTVGDLFQAIQ